jgi:hypothetical protein
MKPHDIKTIIICIIFSIIFSEVVYGQEYLFRVIALSGKVMYQRSTDSNWEKLKTGNKIYTGENLKLEKGDYLGLINNQGRSLEIKQAGIYKADDLIKNVGKSISGLQKFADFVINESSANKKKSENMKTLGAVVRNRAGLIDCYFPEYTNLLNPSFKASWYSAGKKLTYVFNLIDEKKHTILIKETKDTILSIDLKPIGLLKDRPYTWCVYTKGKDELISDTCTFRVLDEKEINTLTDTINIIKKNLDPNSAVDQFIMVKYLESKNLNYDALRGYDILVKSHPGIEDYTNNYLVFLMRQNIMRKTETLIPIKNK